MSTLLPIHVAAGALAMVLGAVALSVTKGGKIHLRGGLLFVYAMLVMGLTASMLGNILGGLLPVYFVATALTTVRPPSPWTRRVDVAALGIAAGFAADTQEVQRARLFVHGEFTAGQQLDFLDRIQAALGVDIEAAYAFDLVVEQVQTVGQH